MSDAGKKPEPDLDEALGDLDETDGDLDEALPDKNAPHDEVQKLLRRALAELPDENAPHELDDVEVKELLRTALAPPPGAPPPDILRGVQRKLRKRSRGKFYGDGWSTARSPRSTYLFTSILMLALIGLVFLVLIPWGSGALP